MKWKECFENSVCAKFESTRKLAVPDNGAAQERDGLQIVVDGMNTTNPFNMYNGYFSVKFHLRQQANGAAYAANARVSTINGSWMLIKKLNMDYNGMQVMSQDNINHCINSAMLRQGSDSIF